MTKTLKILLITFGIVALGAGGFVYWQKSKTEISSWKTYRNEKYDYEVKYPMGWFSYTDDPADIYLQSEKDAPDLIPGPRARGLEIKVDLISPGNSLVQAIKNELPEGINFTQEKVNIGGISGLKIKTTCEGLGCGAPEWFVIKDNYLYHFHSNLGYTSTFDRILSTFKFIE